jgi:hypothetical protein
MKDFIPVWLRAPRTSTWLLLAALLLAAIAAIAPAQLPVVLYKAALLVLAAILAYWLDRTFFPYARPDGYLAKDWRYGTDEPEGAPDYPLAPGCLWPFVAATLRRALMFIGAVWGMAAGL